MDCSSKLSHVSQGSWHELAGGILHINLEWFTDTLGANFHLIRQTLLLLFLIYSSPFLLSSLHHVAPPHPDPMQSVLQTLGRQYEEEKRCALERQRLMYEQELQQLRQRLTPEKPSHLLDASGLAVSATAVTSSASHKRMRRWSEDRWHPATECGTSTVSCCSDESDNRKRYPAHSVELTCLCLYVCFFSFLL